MFTDQRTLEARLAEVIRQRNEAYLETERLRELVKLLAGNVVPEAHIQRLLHSDSP